MEITIFDCPYCMHPIFRDPFVGILRELPTYNNGLTNKPHPCEQIEANRAFLERCAAKECVK